MDINIKNIIFDLDNTIIKDEEDDALYNKEILKKYGYDENDYYLLHKAIDKYDETLTKEKRYYNKQDMLNFINREMNKNYEIQFIEEILETIGNNWIKRIILKEDIVKILSCKYNLYIYSNFFQKTQEKRIEKIGYAKYFKRIFGADIVGAKQFKKSMENILEEIKATPEECIMIGDSKLTDIACANSVGMKAILYDYNGRRDFKDVQLNNYTVIKKMEELLNLL